MTQAATSARPENFAEKVYQQLKGDLFDFRLLPGDRFSEGDVAARMAMSRTPVRQALYRLEREGYLEVYFRSGWRVRPFDFAYFEELYDLRTVLELAAVKRLCAAAQPPEALIAQRAIWAGGSAPPDSRLLSQQDEDFHCALVEAAGNGEMARIHRDVTEKIRIVRRLDFTQPERIEATYGEHMRILDAICRYRTDEAQWLLANHIQVSRQEVRKITLNILQRARQRPAQA